MYDVKLLVVFLIQKKNLYVVIDLHFTRNNLLNDYNDNTQLVQCETN